jgi:hypothetical protein
VSEVRVAVEEQQAGSPAAREREERAEDDAAVSA